jgi:hypothetical protein
VLVSLLYVLLGRLIALVLLCFRSSEHKELEIVVQRHEMAVLRRQVSRWRYGPPTARCWPQRAPRRRPGTIVSAGDVNKAQARPGW